MSTSVNKELVVQFFEEIWNQGDETAIDRYLTDDTVGNDPEFGTGREAFRAQWKKWRTAFPDIHFALEDLVAEDDKVVSRWQMTGTHSGEFLGIAPTGRRVSVTGMSLDRFAGGQLVEGCDAWDALGLRQQLGAIPSTDGADRDR